MTEVMTINDVLGIGSEGPSIVMASTNAFALTEEELAMVYGGSWGTAVAVATVVIAASAVVVTGGAALAVGGVGWGLSAVAGGMGAATGAALGLGIGALVSGGS
jgi:hypothetical protein